MPTGKHGRMAYVFGFLISQGVKTHFPKTDGFSNSNLSCHTFPIPCNNQPNQFLAVINDWVNETRKVVDSLMGSPFDIWLFPIGPKGLNISPCCSCNIFPKFKNFGTLLLFHFFSTPWFCLMFAQEILLCQCCFMVCIDFFPAIGSV